MGFLVWLLGLCSNLLVVFLCLLVIVVIVTLDAAADASTSKRKNLDGKKKKKKSGVKDAKLGGGAKGSRKKKRVEFMDDVVVVMRKCNGDEVSENLDEDVELCESMPEKVGFLASSSERRLTVGREDDCNLMVDVDDVVVVRSVDRLDDFDQAADVFEWSGEIAVKDGYVERWVEEGLKETRDEGGEMSVGGCDDANVTKDIERADGSKNIGTHAVAEIAEENSGVKAREGVTSCSEGFPVEQDINIDMLGTDDRLGSMNDNEQVGKCSDAAAGKRVANNAEYLENELQVKCLDDVNGLKLNSEDVIDDIDAGMTGGVANDPELLEAELGRHTVLDEDRVSLTNDDIVTNERVVVVGERMAKNGEHLEEELDGEAIEGQKGKTINSVVALAESEAAAREIADGKSEFSETELKGDGADENIDKFSGKEEDLIPLWTNESENLVVEEVIKYKKSCNDSNVALVSDNVAGCLMEAGRVVYEGKKVILRDEEVHDNGDYEDTGDDDDWEGVERSELEKVFAEAVNYVEYEWKLKDNWSANSMADIPKRLYGLHKLATEGPCNVPPPMALKVTARAKWNAWHSLGNMSPEVAMEEYVRILSEADPECMRDSTAQEGDMRHSLEAGVEGSLDYELYSSEDSQTNFGRTKIKKA